jgi:hypothetical protein
VGEKLFIKKLQNILHKYLFINLFFLKVVTDKGKGINVLQQQQQQPGARAGQERRDQQ